MHHWKVRQYMDKFPQRKPLNFIQVSLARRLKSLHCLVFTSQQTVSGVPSTYKSSYAKIWSYLSRTKKAIRNLQKWYRSVDKKNSAARSAAAKPHLQDRTCSRWYDPQRPPGRKWSSKSPVQPVVKGIVYLLHCFILHPFWLLLQVFHHFWGNAGIKWYAGTGNTALTSCKICKQHGSRYHKDKNMLFFFRKLPTTLALALQLLSLKISILGTNHRSLTLPGIITYASCPRMASSRCMMRCLASTKVTIPSKCLQTTIWSTSCQHETENEGTRGTPNHWICWRPALLHKSDRQRKWLLHLALGKKPAKVQLLLHIIVRKEGLSLLRKQKGQGATPFSNSWTYITKDLYHIIYFWIPPCTTTLNHQYPCNIYLCGFLCNLSGSWKKCCKYPTTGAGSANPVVSMITWLRRKIPDPSSVRIFFVGLQTDCWTYLIEKKSLLFVEIKTRLWGWVSCCAMSMLREDFIMNRSLMVIEV